MENISSVISNTTEINLYNETFVGTTENSNIIKSIIGIYFSILFIGFCLNCGLLISLLLQKKQGTTYIILQFAFIDFFGTWLAASEIWSLYSSNWTFNSILCPLFLGSEVLINVIVIYMHILINFHAISAWNMQKNNADLIKNPLTSDNDELNECLIWTENSSPNGPNRILNIDYRHKKNSVSIILPSIFIWFTCLSLSIPEFTLTTTVEYQSNLTLCTIVDLHYTQLLQYLLVFFRDMLPLPLLILTFLVALFKLCSKASLSNVKKNSSGKKFAELKKLLQLSIILSSLYVMLSFQRSIILCFHIIFRQFNKATVENFKMPPLDNIIVSNYIHVFLSMLHYCGIILRPVVFISIIPSTITYLKDCIIQNKDKNNKI